MNERVKLSSQDIRSAREQNSKMRERDLAAQLGVSEAELVAAYCGEGVRRLDPRVNDVLLGLKAVGEVMALTRNESAVHEKIGVYDKVQTGVHASLLLGEHIDLRIFPKVWAHGYAVEKRDGDDVRRSLQFFDDAGEAVHKIHLRPSSNIKAFEALVDSLVSSDQSAEIELKGVAIAESVSEPAGSVEELRDRWSRLTDVHQFFGMLRALKISRHQALDMVGQDYAWRLSEDSLAALFSHAAADGMPIMCFVGNRGCIQIHSGPIRNIKPMGPWINVMDDTFHLHLRADHVRDLWVVRKPTKDGHVTSIEAYDSRNELIIQFFGQRHEGEAERDDWRRLAENLPRVPVRTAA